MRKSRLAPALGLAVVVVGGAGAVFLAARHSKPVGGSGLGVAGQTQKIPHPQPPTPNPQAATSAMKWPLPHAIAGEIVATDERFDADKLRVQSTAKRDATKVRDDYVQILAALRAWLPTTDLAAARALAHDFRVPPLNLVIVPQSQLDDAALWDAPTDPNSTYAYRYVDKKRTLFVNDTKGFERHGLPDGVALHVLNPVVALSTDDILRLAEKFEQDYNSKSH
jgi:hypothetical protein